MGDGNNEGLRDSRGRFIKGSKANTVNGKNYKRATKKDWEIFIYDNRKLAQKTLNKLAERDPAKFLDIFYKLQSWVYPSEKPISRKTITHKDNRKQIVLQPVNVEVVREDKPLKLAEAIEGETVNV